MKKLIDAIEEVRNTIDEIRLVHMRDLQGVRWTALRKAEGLLGVLQSILRGKNPVDAFGAPGDWGYDTSLGKGVLEAIRNADEGDVHGLLQREGMGK